MNRSLALLSSLALLLGFASGAAAQPAEPPPVPPPAADAPDVEATVSDEELETFVEIYVDLQETAAKYESEMAAAETPEEAQNVQEQMRDESIQTIEAHGWSLDQYNTVAQSVNANPELVQEALRLIEERS